MREILKYHHNSYIFAKEILSAHLQGLTYQALYSKQSA